jgi:hypothetical protein
MSFEPQTPTSKEFVQRAISFIFWRPEHNSSLPTRWQRISSGTRHWYTTVSLRLTSLAQRPDLQGEELEPGILTGPEIRRLPPVKDQSCKAG